MAAGAPLNSFVGPHANMDTPTPPKTTSFSHQAAKVSWVCPIIFFVLLFQIDTQIITDLLGFLLIAAGLIFGITALFGISKHGTKGILVPAIVGIITNGLWLYIGVTNFMAARARAMQQHRSIEASPVVAMSPNTLLAQGQELVHTIKEEAQKAAKAVMASDYDGIARYTPARLVKGMGGKEATIGVLERAKAKRRASGTEFAEVTLGTPTQPKRIGGWLTSLVSERVVMKVPGGQLQTDSSLLGISEDGGRHWVFLDLGHVKKERFDQLFPELADKITLPEKRPPVFKKDAGA